MRPSLATPESVDLVLAHGACFDGFTSLWVAQLARGDKAEYREVFHGAPESEIPDVTGRNVAIIDFAYKREILERLAAKAKSLIVLDHHESAQRDLEEFPYAVFDMTRSGARMAYDWFNPLLGTISKAHANKMTAYVQDRDLWQWRLLHSKEISNALGSRELTFDDWDDFAWRLVDQFDALVAEGKAITRTMDKQVRQLSNAAALGRINGQLIWAVNGPYTHASELGNLLCKRNDGPGAAAVWRYDHARGHTYVSLRSSAESNINVAKMAEAFGGGGHARAAGFQLDGPPGALSFLSAP